MIKKWKLLGQKKVFESNFITLFQEKLEKEDGEVVDDYYSVKRRDAVFAVALTKDLKIVLVYQYKNGVKKVIWEIPAGFIEDNEKPEEAGRRELLEETGFTSKEGVKVGGFIPNTGISPNVNYVYLFLEAEKIKEQNLDKNEAIEVKLFPLKLLVEEIKKRKTFFIDTQSQLALLLVWELLLERKIFL